MLPIFLIRSVRRQYTGFTLIELMVCVAILGLIVVIALPSYQQHVAKSRRLDIQAELLQHAQILERQYSRTGSYPAAYSATSTEHYEFEYESDQASFVLSVEALEDSPQNQDQQDNVSCKALSINSVGAQTPVGCW